MILLPWYMYWLSISAAMFMGFLVCALLSVGGRVSIREDEKPQDDYIDWSKIPDGYDWVEADRSGNVCAFIHEPDKDYAPKLGLWCVNDIDHTFYDVPKSAIIGPLPPWRESLRRRPGK